tara:strand:+ start:580 stop:708 length:129 start_codon:yes stop_codon:yes gene_type:complete
MFEFLKLAMDCCISFDRSRNTAKTMPTYRKAGVDVDIVFTYL